jgi:hypothetical protein
MKSLTLLLKWVLDETSTWCHVSASQDYKTALARIENEGISFLTITLPLYGKDFERSLDLGVVDPSLFTGFRRGKGVLPLFLGGYLGLIFDRDTGRLLDKPDIIAIQSIRQITLMFGKIELPCTSARELAAVKKYIECESEVRQGDKNLSAARKEQFSRISRLLWTDTFVAADKAVFDGVTVPRHGPGSTAERLLGNEKYLQQEWTTRLESYFPLYETVASSYSLALENLSEANYREPRDERPVRVVLVPKTLSTPRIIAIEPTCMQYTQQAIMAVLEENFRRYDYPRSFIEYSSQIPNQDLARMGSLSGEFATLDLSEASDRVSNRHVRLLLKNHPHLLGAVDACRSRKADVPYGYGIRRLAKFASMGSALCFPFEALVFCTVVFMGIEDELKRQLTKKDLNSFLGRVRVYGDDIIVPVEYTLSVITALESFGFKVNMRKSFWTGKFRESCGKEYYEGHDVTLARVRSVFPTSRKDAEELASLVSLRNRLYELGYWRTCKELDEIIESIIPFPATLPESPALGKLSYLGYETHGTTQTTQSPFVKAVVLSSTLPVSKLDGYAALMKFFLRGGQETYSPLREIKIADVKHLQRSGRPVSVDIKYRKVSPV